MSDKMKPQKKHSREVEGGCDRVAKRGREAATEWGQERVANGSVWELEGERKRRWELEIRYLGLGFGL